ncbi:hypothetical protein MTO96_019962 [Rhipicephalus appendiculatus]
MSISGLQPPPPFLSSPGHPDIPWEQWIQSFKIYMIASGASDLPAIRRKAILLNCLGLEGLRIFQTLKTTDDPCLVAASAAGGTLTSPSLDDFDRAIATLEGHFKSTVNVTAARHRFRRRTQAPGFPRDYFEGASEGLSVFKLGQNFRAALNHEAIAGDVCLTTQWE